MALSRSVAVDATKGKQNVRPKILSTAEKHKVKKARTSPVSSAGSSKLFHIYTKMILSSIFYYIL